MASLVDETGKRRLVRREVEVARAGFVPRVVVIETILRAEFDIVLAPDISHIDLANRRTVIRSAFVTRAQSSACANSATLIRLSGEIENGECRTGYVLQTDLRGPVLIDIRTFIHVAEP